MIVFIFFIYGEYVNTASAESFGPCIPVGGTHVFTYDNVNGSVDSVGKNKAGEVLENSFTYSLDGKFSTTGCNAKAAGYITTTSSLPKLSNDGQRTWYVLNEYLAVSFESWVGGYVSKYIPVPFISESNKTVTSSQSVWSSGSKGRVSLKIIKPFVGFSAFSKSVLHTQISKSPDIGEAGPYVSELFMSGEVDVPQSCELNSGDYITMSFGDIGAPSFSQAGAGNRPAGINPQTKNIGIKCKNMDAQAMLSMRLEADKVSGNVMVSDNKDVGFIIADVDHKPLTPNNIDSKIPFRLDDNFSATVPVSAWPVSVTGNKPAEGKFTAAGYLRVDFD
ncbi:hypothetical protein CD006_26405 [Enterobacter sp. 10-1]|nr:fimbrial protein [Raoultella sp. 10-1]MVT06074.1 fimbrial protein [Raoultella sp. 10-1]PAC07411.1 hypothetical protein CD006_26405 [Enterobacter sp. 10-1]